MAHLPEITLHFDSDRFIADLKRAINRAVSESLQDIGKYLKTENRNAGADALSACLLFKTVARTGS
jgi:hypothetical protein